VENLRPIVEKIDGAVETMHTRLPKQSIKGSDRGRKRRTFHRKVRNDFATFADNQNGGCL
jgi:hypothetical protein